MYEERVYRRGMSGGSGMMDFEVVEQETDLWISMELSAYYPGIEREIRAFAVDLREELLGYIREDPIFLTSLEPHQALPGAPRIAADMAAATEKAGVGPMAAVAGAFARDVGRAIRRKTDCRRLMVENGGDIYILGQGPLTVAVYAGSSPLSDKVGISLEVSGEFGVCTSSGTVGHSLSFGRADAMAVISEDVVVADAFATAYCNQIQSKDDIGPVLEQAKLCPDITGAMVIIGDALGAWGDLELVSL